MKTKQTIPTIIALIAVIAVAVPPMAFAVDGEIENSIADPQTMKHKIGKIVRDLPELIFSDESVPRGQSLSENLDKDVISITDAIASADGRVLKAGLKPLQGYLVYHLKVVSNDIITHVIVDAGNGDVLHISDGKTIEEIEALHVERKQIKTEKRLEKLDNRIDRLADRLEQSSGNDELDALKQQFIDKLTELREAIANGSSDSIRELKDELKDLRSQIKEMRE